MTEEEMQVAASGIELPLGDTTTTGGYSFYSNDRFSFPSYRSCFNTCLYDIRRDAVTSEGKTSSNITKIIEKLAQSEGFEVPKTSTGEVHMGTTSVAGESSRSGERTCHLQPLNLVRYNNLILLL